VIIRKVSNACAVGAWRKREEEEDEEEGDEGLN